jgi:hypothetical protein
LSTGVPAAVVSPGGSTEAADNLSSTELAKIENVAAAYADQKCEHWLSFLVVHVFNATEIVEARELTEIMSAR